VVPLPFTPHQKVEGLCPGSLPAVASCKLVRGIDQRIQAAVSLRPRFCELAKEFVNAAPDLATASIGFFALPSERHRYINQLASFVTLGLNKAPRFRLPPFEQFHVRPEFGPLLNDEVHP
jgi:hypothetical protein